MLIKRGCDHRSKSARLLTSKLICVFWWLDCDMLGSGVGSETGKAEELICLRRVSSSIHIMETWYLDSNQLDSSVVRW